LIFTSTRTSEHRVDSPVRPLRLLVGEPHAERGGRVGEVPGPGGPTIGADHRVAQRPGEGDLRHRDAAPGGDRLHRVDDRLVVVWHQLTGDGIGLAAGGLLASRPGQVPLGEGLHGMEPTPWSASRPNISRTSSRCIRLYWFCIEVNSVKPCSRAVYCILENGHAHMLDAPR
jgi:hypothetical protein